MANIWIDPVANNENRVGVGGAPAGKSHVPSKTVLTHSVKKQAFGALQNVMHNHNQQHGFQAATPYKSSDPLPSRLLFSTIKSKSAYSSNETKLKHNSLELERVQNVLFQDKPSAEVVSEQEFIFDFSDAPKPCCTGESYKSMEEIWSSMASINDEFLDKLLSGGDPDSDTVVEMDYGKDLFEVSDLDDSFEDSFGMPSIHINAGENKDEFINTLEFELPVLSDSDDLDIDMSF